MPENKMDSFSQYHPLVNFLFFAGAIGFAVVIQHPLYLAVGFVAGAVYYLMLHGRKGLNMLWMLIPMFLIISAINPLFNLGGAHPLFYLFGRPYTFESLCYGMVIAAMFMSMMAWFGCYNAVLTSDKFTSLFGNLIPALSLLMVMILRMIPNFIRKAGQIIGCRRSIGKGVSAENSFKEKAVDGLTILSSLTDWALEGSVITGDSMRARGYGTARRTSFQIYRMTARDWVLLVLEVLLFLLVLLFANVSVELVPEIMISAPNWAFVPYCIFFLIPIALQIKENITWHISISRI